MSLLPPTIVIIAGPNGAGKSTAAPLLLQKYFSVSTFVNADVIASGLSAFQPEAVALEAGRIMWTRLNSLAASKESFAFETTLASRTFAPWLRARKHEGYQVHLVFLALPSAEVAIERVKCRVRAGGHSVPDDVIRRRFQRGITNLKDIYLEVVDEWEVFDASDVAGPKLITSKTAGAERLEQTAFWQLLKKGSQ